MVTGKTDGGLADRLATLRALSLFAGLSDADLRRVDAIGTELDVPAGRRLMTQGETGREALVILSGTADVTVDGNQSASVGAGEVLGEMALLDHQPRVATVTAQTPMRLLVLDHAQFGDLMADEKIAQAVTEAVRRRRATPKH
jgi:CRP/FNR family transcriptional regulator, cyclic AMP receptor protein